MSAFTSEVQINKYELCWGLSTDYSIRPYFHDPDSPLILLYKGSINVESDYKKRLKEYPKHGYEASDIIVPDQTIFDQVFNPIEEVLLQLRPELIDTCYR